MRLAAVLIIFAMVATACSENSPRPSSPTPTEPVASTTPAPVPGLFIVAPDGTGTSGAAGTRCWVNGCIDYVGPVTHPDPVVFPAGAALQWQAEGGTVTEFQHAWVPTAGMPSTLTSDGLRLWPTGHGDMIGEPVTIPRKPGEYLLIVFTRYSTGGDVSFGFYISVE